MVVDRFAPEPSFFRHQTRVLGAYTLDADGVATNDLGSYRLPRVLHGVLTEFSSADPIPSEALRDLAVPAYALPAGSHGFSVFRYLVDRAVSNPFVLVQLDWSLKTTITEEDCNAADKEALVSRLGRSAVAQAKSLTDIMERHGVEFVNASLGYTTEDVRRFWSFRCSSPLDLSAARRIVEQEAPIFRALFGRENVFSAHAASATLMAPEDAPFDGPRDDYPGRIRVGVIASATLDIAEAGAPYVADVGAIPSAPGADVWIHYGCDRDGSCRAPMRLASFSGFGLSRQEDPHSSWATPLAVAWAAYEADKHGLSRPLQAADVQELRRRLTDGDCAGACPLRDPVKFRRFSACEGDYISICDME